MIDLNSWQKCALDMTLDRAITLISAPRGAGKTTLGMLAARIVAEEGAHAAFVSEYIRSWDDYYGPVFTDITKNKKLKIRTPKFDGRFHSGGMIELIAPNQISRVFPGRYYDYIVVDNADMLTDEQALGIEQDPYAAGMMFLGYFIGSNAWFKNRWSRAENYGYNSFSFHAFSTENHYARTAANRR